MYQSFYNLKSKPFSEHMDSELIWVNESFREALTVYKSSIMDERGIFLVTGGSGTGKTCFVDKLISSLGDEVVVGTILNPNFSLTEFWEVVAYAFQIEKEYGGNSNFRKVFKEYLTSLAAINRLALLIIDEAQSLRTELLEGIRALSEIRCDGKKTLTVLLVGHNRLNTVLFQPENKALRRRIITSYNIKEFTEEETEEYIQYHLCLAGNDQDIFTAEARREIYSFSRGIPRVINILCDLALVVGFSKAAYPISRQIILECINDLFLLDNKSQSLLTVIGSKAEDFRNRLQKNEWKKIHRHILLYRSRLPDIGAKAEDFRNRLKKNGWEKIYPRILLHPGTPVAILLVILASFQFYHKDRDGRGFDTSKQEQLPAAMADAGLSTLHVPVGLSQLDASETFVSAITSPNNKFSLEMRASILESLKAYESPPESSNRKAGQQNHENDALQIVAKPDPNKDGDDSQVLAAAPGRAANLFKASNKEISQIQIAQQEDLQKIPGKGDGIYPDNHSSFPQMVIVDSENVFEGSSLDSPVVTLVRKGETVTELQHEESWYFVRLEDGRQGWIYKNTLSEANSISPENKAVVVSAEETPKTSPLQENNDPLSWMSAPNRFAD